MARIFLLCILFSNGLFACEKGQPNSEQTTQVSTTTDDDPARWEEDIAAYEAKDAENAPPQDAMVFIGSSSIRLWSTLKEDMSPMPVINRGFGGSKLADATYYIDRIITPYAPRAIVAFTGSNDIAGDNPKSAEAVLALYEEFATEVHKRLPNTPIYYIAISPTRARWQHHQIVADANALIAAYSDNHDSLFFIDTASALLDTDGQPREELFKEDKLHLNKDGYAVWTSIIRPTLEELYP